MRFRNFATELFEGSLKWFLVSYVMYQSSDSSVEWQKVLSYTDGTTVGFVDNRKVSYHFCETLQRFLVGFKVLYILYETIDGFVDHLRVLSYLCETFRHFPVGLKDS